MYALYALYTWYALCDIYAKFTLFTLSSIFTLKVILCYEQTAAKEHQQNFHNYANLIKGI